MRFIKQSLSIVFLLVTLALVTSCAQLGDSGATRYQNGYYKATMQYGYEDVYSATIEAIESGETYDTNGNPYQIKLNKKTDESVIIEASSSGDHSDYLEVIIKPKSDEVTSLSIKYGADGDSIRSSALENIIEGNVKYGNL